MATRRDVVGKYQILQRDDAFCKTLKAGTVVTMSDGWRGRVLHDDGEVVSMIKDGESMNTAFKGCRGIVRKSLRFGGIPMIGRSQVVDLAARKILRCDASVVDRKRLRAEWDSAPGYAN